MNSPPPKPEAILTNFFAEPTVLLVPITSRVYVILEYRVPWLEIYKHPLPDGGLLRDFNQVVYCRGINSLVSVEMPKIDT